MSFTDCYIGQAWENFIGSRLLSPLPVRARASSTLFYSQRLFKTPMSSPSVLRFPTRTSGCSPRHFLRPLCHSPFFSPALVQTTAESCCFIFLEMPILRLLLHRPTTLSTFTLTVDEVHRSPKVPHSLQKNRPILRRYPYSPVQVDSSWDSPTWTQASKFIGFLATPPRVVGNETIKCAR